MSTDNETSAFLRALLGDRPASADLSPEDSHDLHTVRAIFGASNDNNEEN